MIISQHWGKTHCRKRLYLFKRNQQTQAIIQRRSGTETVFQATLKILLCQIPSASIRCECQGQERKPLLRNGTEDREDVGSSTIILQIIIHFHLKCKIPNSTSIDNMKVSKAEAYFKCFLHLAIQSRFFTLKYFTKILEILCSFMVVLFI